MPTDIVRNFSRLPHFTARRMTVAYQQIKCAQEYANDHEVCGPADIMRCKGYGYEHDSRFTFANDYTVKSLDTKIVKDHGYCLKVDNNQVYDSISREDEEKVLGTNQPTINYNVLVNSKCDPNPSDHWYGTDGIQCSNIHNFGRCMTIKDWCL